MSTARSATCRSPARAVRADQLTFSVRRPIWALVLAALVLLAGCGRLPDVDREVSSSPSASAAVRQAALHGLLQRLTAAINTADRNAYDQQLSDRDPGFGARAEMIFSNLDQVRPTEFSLHATGRTEDLAPDRAQLIGEDGYAAEVRVSWGMPGEPSPSDQLIWLSIADEDGTAQWAGTADGPGESRPTPLWWLEPVVVARTPHASVIAGSGIDADRWAALAEEAAVQVTSRLPADKKSDPDGDPSERLVLIMPSNQKLLEQTMGVAEGSQAQLAAITWPDGSKLSRAPMRIMINPAAHLGSEGIRVVLAHETVHVATRSPASAAPTWLVEGLADYLAFDLHPDAAGPAEQLVADAVERSGPPKTWPDEQAFDASGGALDLAYAQAWLACRTLAEANGEDELFDFYRRVDQGTVIDRAAMEAFDVDQDQLLKQWRAALTSVAESRS